MMCIFRRYHFIVYVTSPFSPLKISSYKKGLVHLPQELIISKNLLLTYDDMLKNVLYKLFVSFPDFEQITIFSYSSFMIKF